MPPGTLARMMTLRKELGAVTSRELADVEDYGDFATVMVYELKFQGKSGSFLERISVQYREGQWKPFYWTIDPKK
jgi:hypothetical protein